jgi:hypothetical protein
MADDASSKKVFKRWSLTFVSGAFAVALALLYVLVLRSIAVQIAPPPEPASEPYPDVSTEELCEAEGGRWVARAPDQADRAVAPRPLADDPQPYCQGPLAFEREREQQEESNRQTSLFVFVIGGALAVASSLLVQLLKAVAPGLMIGGIVSFFIAGVDVWMLAPGIGRLITIVVVFLALTGIGIYVFREHEKV